MIGLTYQIILIFDLIEIMLIGMVFESRCFFNFNDKRNEMELVPIIYNSLILVFTLLALVIGGSLICSKLLFCGNSQVKKGNSKKKGINSIEASRKKDPVKINLVKKVELEERKGVPKIERKLIDNKKVKVVSRSESQKKEKAKRVAANKAARYSVLNSESEEQISKRDLFSKFSKMSIEYSQSS